MDKQADGSYKKSFTEFFGKGYIHVKPVVGSGDSTIWQWQVYIGDCQNLADPNAPHYRGNHADPELALQGAKIWLVDYFVHMKG